MMRTLLFTLLAHDARQIARQRLLAMLLALALLMGLAARFGLPFLDATLSERGVLPSAHTAMRLSDTYPLWVAFFGLWQASLLPGTVFGFVLLDEKERETLTAMRVTPVPMRVYLAYKVALPYLTAVVFILAIVPMIGLAQLAWWELLVIAPMAALSAPLVTIGIATFARDKVQGLAFTKFFGLMGLVILGAWFISPVGRWVLGALLPPLMSAQAYWLALDSEPLWWVASLCAGAAQGALLAWLIGRFARA